MMNKGVKQDSQKKRTIIQLIVLALTNGYIQGFTSGKIYAGPSKFICVPGLNCYSCPGAFGSCPIGAIQAVLGSRNYSFSYYVLGIAIFFGVLLGRVVCGFLCPFGFFQDLLHKIKVKKYKVPLKFDRGLRKLKYLLGIFVVVLASIFITNKYGIAVPYFCKYFCPVGGLEGGIPLVSTNAQLQAQVSWLFGWKMFTLLVVIVASMFSYRPFCKYICPLGAFYGLFNKISFYQMNLDEKKCIGCNKCVIVCPMDVAVRKNINSAECIRCGKCKDVCPTDAISSGFKLK